MFGDCTDFLIVYVLKKYKKILQLTAELQLAGSCYLIDKLSSPGEVPRSLNIWLQFELWNTIPLTPQLKRSIVRERKISYLFLAPLSLRRDNVMAPVFTDCANSTDTHLIRSAEELQ